jgi:DNA-binding NarL/FixJ family response regulator
MTVRVLVADDQHLVRAGFRLILSGQPDIDVIGEAATGLEAVAMARELRPDVVLMDIRMPELDGIEATRQITVAQTDPSAGAAPPAPTDRPPRVLILTTFDLDEYVYDALRAGASGFLLKDTPPAQLAASIRTLDEGVSLLAPSVTRRLIEEFGSSRRRPTEAPAALEELTPREREVLLLIARGLSNMEIADLLVIAETTVRTHVNRILMKLGLRDRVQAVVLGYEAGLVTPGDVR